ncbi:unnamed protein product [Miscanthus lutarioriparius]|uniref:RRM domain-containing protein n=1 Tax=Miscanthus lutarioriparius TaxID=422564 RepID=A0A811NBJ2_9POAL|nr:unnamed protein product [Miscanthus lutarioriparius]
MRWTPPKHVLFKSPRAVLPLHPNPSSEVAQAGRTAVLHFSARLPRKITRKVRTIKRRVPKGTIAARKAAAEAALAATRALQPGKGHAPDNSSRNAATVDEVVQKEQSFGGNTIEKPGTAVCETLLGKGTAVCETLLGKGTVRGGTLASGPATDIGGEHEVKKLGSRGEDRAEVVMSERQRRMMTEVFVGGLSRDTKEEDVRAALSVAGDITEVRMILDATMKKNKGYCFVRYCESAQARKAIAKFSNVKICGKQCRVAALGGNDKIFLGNLDKKWKKDDIMKLLQKIGVENIDVVTLPADSNNPGYNRGFAFLELETYKDAQIAYKKLSRKDVFGKGLHIRVAWAEPLNGPDEKQIHKSFFTGPVTVEHHSWLCFQWLVTNSQRVVNIRVTLAQSIQKGKKIMEDHKFCISEKDKTKTAQSERILGPSSLHILPSSSRAIPPTGDKKSSTDHGLVQVLREMVPWRHEHTGSDSDSVLSEEPWGGIQGTGWSVDHPDHPLDLPLAKKLVAEFGKLKICWKLCQVEALDGNDKIVLENIDKKWKKEDIMKLLHKSGVENIDTVTLMADCDNPGYNCGYAFLELETERDTWMAYIKLSRKGV